MPPGTQVGPFSEIRCNVKCVIVDESKPGSRSVQNLPSSTTISELYQLFAEHAVCNIDDFLLLYLKPMDQADEEIALDKNSQKTLTEIVKRNQETECKFVMRRTSNSKEATENSDDDSPLGCVGPMLQNDSMSYGAVAAQAPSGSLLGPTQRAFTGLINQAMTCYLNSLLQTLFMTPEFRNALYRWEYQGDAVDAEKCIPFQLQKLFLKMQTTKKMSVETTDLTHSFGWDSSEAWQQHDVQELCRVMFDALEETLKNTEQEHLINQLYQGKMKDYVKCLKCSYESAREDTYLDIPLAIRPFGAQQAHESLEEALQQFVGSETLEGNNQYFCEKCNAKQDAQKGLKFVTFPYLLTFQLKRFTFDYTSLQRIKLHDRLTFADVLDMNQCCKDLCNSFEAMKLSNGKSDTSEDELPPQSQVECNHVGPCSSSQEEATVSTEVTENKADSKYELFSIMIHSGNALGGHYYAYIKSFTDGKWYCFNDQTVSPITQAEVENSYGGSEKRSRQFSNYASSTNAYMLLYRQINEKKNAQFMTAEEWPEHIKKLALDLEREETDEAVQKEKDRNTCKVRIFAKHPKTMQVLENRLEIHKDKTLTDARDMAWTLFGLNDVVAIDDCRLIKYDSTYEAYERSFEGQEDDSIQDVLGGMRYSYGFDLLLEIKESTAVFLPYKSDGTTIKVFDVNLETSEVKLKTTTHLSASDTVEDLKSHLDIYHGYSKESSRVVLGRNYNDFRLLTATTMSLRFEGFGRSSKIFVEASGNEEQEITFNKSKMLEVLDQFANTIKLNVTLPFLNVAANASQEIETFVDKRKTLQELKEILHPHVKIPPENFRVYKVLSSNQELESTKLNEQLTSFIDDMKIIIRPGKALQIGEARVKIYHFKPNDTTPISFFMEAIIAPDSSVLDLKQKILPEVVKHLRSDATIERIRLRKKSWKNPSQILLNKIVFGQDVSVSCAMEYLLELLEDDDAYQSATDRSLYAKRWRPSSHTFDEFIEVVVNDKTVECVKEELSRVSSLPASDIEIAKGRGIFPCDICPLDISRELDWDPNVRTIQECPMSIIEDGAVLYFRDKNEQLEELTEASEKQIKETSSNRRPQQSISSKQAKGSLRSRKEKALKIYTNKSTKIS